MTLTTRLFIGLIMGCTAFCDAQIETYTYKRELTDVTDEWHKITLPNAVFGKVKSDLSDLRIYGITVNNDTIEAPYLVRILSENVIHKTIPFDIINKTKGDGGYYFTFQLNSDVRINQINLNFKEQNFDWKIDLQGSQNQQEWFTIEEDYRLLSIRNETTNFKFTKLNFSETKYRFYRLLVKTNEQPQLQSAQLSQNEIVQGSSINHPIKKLKAQDDKALKTTTLDLDLEQAVPISQIGIDVKSTFDFYRPLKIEYRHDSTKTEKGWKYYYKTITSGTLNSLEANRFKFPNTTAKHLKITIYNADNQPLHISDVAISGSEFQMVGRFNAAADYMLVYGNTSVNKPNYDINKFEIKVPKTLKALTIGAEERILKPHQKKVKPLFENSYWLWGIITVIMLILGGFTLGMLRKR